MAPNVKKKLLMGLMSTLANLLKLAPGLGTLNGSFATTMDRPIFVLHEIGEVYGFCPQDSNRDIFLYYSKQEGHYEDLSVSPEAALRLRAKAPEGKTKGGRGLHRGGGRTESVGGCTAESLFVGVGPPSERTASC